MRRTPEPDTPEADRTQAAGHSRVAGRSREAVAGDRSRVAGRNREAAVGDRSRVAAGRSREAACHTAVAADIRVARAAAGTRSADSPVSPGASGRKPVGP